MTTDNITKRAEALLAGLGRYTPADARRLWLDAPDLVRGLLDEVRRLEKERDEVRGRVLHLREHGTLQHMADVAAIRDEVARLKAERRATIAYLLDRAEQYDNASGYVAFVEEMIGDLAEGRHVENHAAGEYDDMSERLDRIERSHAGKASDEQGDL